MDLAAELRLSFKALLQLSSIQTLRLPDPCLRAVLDGCAHEPPDALSGRSRYVLGESTVPRALFSTSTNSELHFISIPVRRGIHSSFLFGSARVVSSVPSTQGNIWPRCPHREIALEKKEPAETFAPRCSSRYHGQTGQFLAIRAGRRTVTTECDLEIVRPASACRARERS